MLSDRIGRKYTVVLGAIAKLVSLVCYASGQSYAVFVSGAIFDGLSLAFHSGNNDALLYDTVGELGEEGNITNIWAELPRCSILR